MINDGSFFFFFFSFGGSCPSSSPNHRPHKHGARNGPVFAVRDSPYPLDGRFRASILDGRTGRTDLTAKAPPRSPLRLFVVFCHSVCRLLACFSAFPFPSSIGTRLNSSKPAKKSFSTRRKCFLMIYEPKL